MGSCVFWELSAQLECDDNPIRRVGLEVPHCLRSVVKRYVSGWMSFGAGPSAVVVLDSIFHTRLRGKAQLTSGV